MNYLKFCLFILICFNTASFAANFKVSGPHQKVDVPRHKSFLVYPGDREKPIKWYDSLPEGTLKELNHPKVFVMKAQPGEYHIYQLGVKALKKEVNDVQIVFSDLKAKNGKTIPAGKMTCFNKDGIDFKGNPFSKRIDIPAGRIQALWISMDLEGISKGEYTGTVTVMANGEKQVVPLMLKVEGETVSNHGFNEASRLARLNWLNSTTGINEEITKGYLPVKVEGNRISILGRTLSLAENGLPSSIVSYFGPSNQSFVEQGEPIVNHAFRFIIEKENGEMIRLTPGELTFTHQSPSRIDWDVVNTSKEFVLSCSGEMEFDGFVDYHLKLTAKASEKVKDIRLEIPVISDKAEYMMGLGHEGGYLTPGWKWQWDVSKNQDMLWVGAVNGGLRIKWKAENYVRPLVNVYYAFGPLKMPPSWSNEGRGGVDVKQQNKEVVINAYSGNREMRPGEVLNYDFELLITPFRLIDRKIKFGDRYYQSSGANTSVKIEDAQKMGANIVNIHHAEDIYPFINYPYLDQNVKDLTKLVADAHQQNMRMKFYYTTRELTKNLPEFWAFNSLNGEVIFPGPGNASRTVLYPKGPNEWLINNLKEKYIPAWSNLVKEGRFKGETDLSVITTPDSRLNNFYIAGLDWMVQNMGIDGVYIDDCALDRLTLQRARKVIDLYRPEGRLDLHSWNHFNQKAGFTNCLNLYMDLLPYFDLVWIGEGRDYNRLPDHWLIEVSGIPFGLTGQMLQGGGNPWRGMVYGITTRAGWTINTPTDIWKFWDDHKFKDKIMTGYWDKKFPVTCSNASIKASLYKGNDETILAVANWKDKDAVTSIDIDWTKLGMDPVNVELLIPEIKDFQTEQTSFSLSKMTIPAKKGYLILLKKKK
ncbi:MAG: DUF6067 family protein [Bacteroidota bacterium]|nr:DUF6067 family protein [Bacteroidota bacterium]